jgi:hypothetical protein
MDDVERAKHALSYLGAYTHRVAISNHRLVAVAEGNVTFRWRDSAHGNKKRLMTLTVDEFLRRFLLHLLPRGFVRIRHFGFLANRRRANLLPLCVQLLNPQVPVARAKPAPSQPHDLTFWKCPHYGGEMKLVERFTAAQIQLRAPPAFCRGAA